ncbi:MAG: HopJ type III effector protein [Chryseobacterium sp.]|nr:HopJ type III effector protein [Chryseobacterium sp.]
MILDQLKNSPEKIDFKEVIAFIDENYDFTPTKFKNGNTVNATNENNGSCKVFSFAKLQNLSKGDTLSLFGAFYREDVLKNPDGNDHQNIRNFMEFGWDGIFFDNEVLKTKSTFL